MAAIKMDFITESMADSSRGQLLIVTAVVIAALIISLSAVLNTALFTEAQSTSVTFSDTARGESLKDSQITNIAQTIETENKQMDGNANSDTQAVIENIDTQTSQRQASYGTVASISHDSTTTGTRVKWDDPDVEFRNDDGNTTWEVTDNIGSIRAYSMNFSTLPPLSNPSKADLQNKSFGIVLNPNDPTENATRYVYTDGGDTRIKGIDETGSATTSCSITDHKTTEIHLTTETLTASGEESPCRSLWPGFDVETIQFENGDTAKGEFEYVRNGGNEGEASEIKTATSIYSLKIIYEYTTSDTEYSTTTRIAKGEP